MTTPHTVWTPDRRAASFPRAYPLNELGPQRVFFYDIESELELESHPLNGMVWTGTGSMVSHIGYYVDGTATVIRGAAWLDCEWRIVTVVASSFPGRKVAAKIWYGIWCGPDSCGLGSDRRVLARRVLARGDGSPVIGKRERINCRAWTHSYIAGLVS